MPEQKADSSNARGEVICEASTDALSPVLMYFLAAISGLLAAPILFASAPMLAGTRRGDLAGGIAGSVIGLVLAGACLLAIKAGRSRSTVYKVQFYSKGVVFGDAPNKFWRYADLKTLSVLVSKPSASTKSQAAIRGVASAIAGDAAGVGAALASGHTGGSILMSRGLERPVTISSLRYVQIAEIADCVQECRGGDSIRIAA